MNYTTSNCSNVGKKKVLIDSSLVVEFFLGRQEYQEVIDDTIEYLKDKNIQVYITDLSIAKLHLYIGINDPSIAEDALTWLEETLEIETIDIKLEDAYLTEGDDIGRGIERLTAENEKLDSIITLSPDEYQSSSLEIILAGCFLVKTIGAISKDYLYNTSPNIKSRVYIKHISQQLECEFLDSDINVPDKNKLSSDLEHDSIECKKRILIDSCLVLDIFLGRNEYKNIVDRVISFTTLNDIKIYITSLSIFKLNFYLGTEKPDILDRAIIWLKQELKAHTIVAELEDILEISSKCIDIDSELEVLAVKKQKLDGILTLSEHKYKFHSGRNTEIDDAAFLSDKNKKFDNSWGLTQLKISSEELKPFRLFITQRLRNLPSDISQSNTLTVANILTECWLSLDKKLKYGQRIPIPSKWFYQESIKIIQSYCELENQDNPSPILDSKIKNLDFLLKQSKFKFFTADRHTFNFAFAHLESCDTENINQKKDNEDIDLLLDEGFDTHSFVDRDLSGIDFSMLELSNIDFSNATLYQTNFRGANLTNCDFTNAKITEAIFHSANLENAIFSHAVDMNRVDFSFANLKNAKFVGINKSNLSQFIRSELKGAIFDGSEIYDSDFRSANLQHASFKSADLTKSSFRCADLTDADLTQATLTQCTFKGTKLVKAKLVKAKLYRSELIRANLKDADLSEAELRGANLNNVVMNRAILEKADLSPFIYKSQEINTQMICGKATGVNFNGAQLNKIQARRSNFREAQFKGANLDDAILQNTNFEYSFLIDAKLRNADLGGAILTKADLSEADLSDARLSGASLRNTILKKAILERAKLHGTYLYEVELQEAKLNFCKAERANFNFSNLNSAELEGAELINTSFIRCELVGAKLNGAKLAGAILNSANLSKANLTSALLRGASLKRTILKKATLNKVEMQGAYLKDAILTQAKINDADLSGCRLKRANLEKAELMGSILNSSDLKYAILRNAKLDRAKLYLVNLMGANCSKASIKYVDLTKVNLSETLLLNVNFSHSNLSKSDFSGADMRGSILHKTILFKSKFLATNLERAKFISSDCRYAYFADTNINGAIFKSVDLRHSYFSNLNLKNTRIDHKCLFQKCTLVDSKLPKINFDSSEVIIKLTTSENAYEEFENNQLIDAEEMLEYFKHSIEQLRDVYKGFNRKPINSENSENYLKILQYLGNQIELANGDYDNAESIFHNYFQSPENFEVNSLELLNEIHNFIYQVSQYRNEVIQICRDPRPIATTEIIGRFPSNIKFNLLERVLVS
jgi:uncharacterized protein YjbI with pentapeptide repeats